MDKTIDSQRRHDKSNTPTLEGKIPRLVNFQDKLYSVMLLCSC